MFKDNCHGSENTSFGSSLFLCSFPLPKVSSARVQLCNQGSHCWEDSQGVRKSWETPHCEPCLGLEPHLCFPLVLGQATLYVCLCPALYPANPNRDLLKWAPSITFDLQLCYGLIWRDWGLTWSAELLCFPCLGATGLCLLMRVLLLPGGAAGFFCSLELGLSFPCGLSILAVIQVLGLSEDAFPLVCLGICWLKLPWGHAVARQPGDVPEILCQWKALEGPG